MPKLKCSTVQCVGKKISLPRTHTLPRDLGKGPGSLVELERASVPRPLHRHTHTHTSQLSLTGQSDSRFTLDKTPFCCESCKDLHVFLDYQSTFGLLQQLLQIFHLSSIQRFFPYWMFFI